GTALQIIHGVIVGEGDADHQLLIRLPPDQLILEAWDQAAGAELERHAGAGAALERLAIDLALIIEHDQIALFGSVLRGGGVVALLALGETADGGVDRL